MPLSTESKNQNVSLYRAAGFRLFPCNRAKRPTSIGWQGTDFDDYPTAESLPDFFAVILPANIVVLDVDPRRYSESGGDTLKDLWAKLGIAPQQTFIVKTGSGGFHIYFRKPSDVLVRGKVPHFPAIDIKTKGGYVMAAGSQHSAGSFYEIVRNSPSEIADIPEALLSYIEREDTSNRKGIDGIDDSEANQQRYVTYLNRRTPGVDPARFEVACEGQNYGLSEDTVFRLMKDFYNPRCLPMMSDFELLQKVHNAFLYANQSAGSKNPLADFKQFMQTEKKEDGDSQEASINEPYKPSDDKVAAFDWGVKKVGDTIIKFLLPTLNNICSYMRLDELESMGLKNPLKGLFKFNEFSEEIEYAKQAPWHRHKDQEYPKTISESELVLFKGWLNDNLHLQVPVNTIFEAVIIESRKYAHHPVREYIRSIKWDGIQRVENLLYTYASAEPSAYNSAVGKCAIIGAIARVFSPGCQHDSMLVLEGDQGTGKTSFVRTLGGQWFADVAIDAHAKDTIHAMLGSWFLEASEMDFTRRQDVSALKRFLTIKHDKVRLSYERVARSIPRQQIFIGTVNPEAGVGYLTDPTGNRRFHPVRCGKINLEKLMDDRDQIFAEAYLLFQAGEPHHLTDPAIIEEAKRQAEMRVYQDNWETCVASWLSDNRFEKPSLLTTDIIAFQALNIPPAKVDRMTSNRIARIMRRLNYFMEHVYDKERKRMVWTWTKDPFAL